MTDLCCLCKNRVVCAGSILLFFLLWYNYGVEHLTGGQQKWENIFLLRTGI